MGKVNILNRKNEKVNSEIGADFGTYIQSIVRDWMQVLTLLAAALIPSFFLLDYFTQPPELHLRFALYRGGTTVAMLIAYLMIRFTHPNRYYPFYGYVISGMIGFMIVLMTVALGGFNSSYYAGLMLVIMAVNMLLAWPPMHSAVNGSLVLILYLILNAFSGQPFDPRILVNNLYFLGSTVVITFAFSWVRFRLVRSEFILRTELLRANQNLDQSRAEVLRARDALWGEMQLAKMIQTALLPDRTTIGEYEVAAFMLPADSVGGDYYDIIDAPNGSRWVGIGDVSGHGVDSGLIMMMAQTAIQTVVQEPGELRPSEVLDRANRVIKDNIGRLGTDRYMTMNLFRLNDGELLVSGKHQDVMVYRAREKKVEVISTNGSWLGIMDDLGSVLEDHRIPIGPGDIIILFTDGITEAQDKTEEMFGEERLIQLVEANAHLPLRKLGNEIFVAVLEFEETQNDDRTLLLLKLEGEER